MRRLAVLLVILSLGSSPGRARQQAGKRPRAEDSRRVRLAPQFAPGQVLRYQMEFRTTTNTTESGLAHDPQGPAQLVVTWDAVVHLEVLPLKPDDASAAPVTRLRTTYEKSVATARSDTYDPEADRIEQQYRKLEGRAIEFMLDVDGKVAKVEGLEGLLRDPKAAAAARDWLAQLSMGASAPREGIVPGQKWSFEQPAASAPLAGLLWRTESTYLRNEPCRPAGPHGAAASDSLAKETCAVILTRLEVTQPHPPKDPTPEDYRRAGVRTAGRWSGSGESLSYISLRTGWVVSVTQSATEEMDVTFYNAHGESLRYAGRVHSQSQVSLMPPAATP